MVPTQPSLPFDPIERAGQIWERTWGPSTQMRLATTVMRVQQILLAKYDEVLRTHGLTFARFEALVLLKFSSKGSLPMKILGDRLQVHATSVTNIIDRLSGAGLVAREQNPRDGRGILAVITEEGMAVVDRAAKDLMSMDFALSSIPDAEIEQVTSILRKLRAGVGDFTLED